VGMTLLGFLLGIVVGTTASAAATPTSKKNIKKY